MAISFCLTRLPNYLAGQMGKRPSTDHPEFKKAESDVRAKIDNLLKVNGKRSLDSIHRELGTLLWDKCGMARNADGLREALAKIPELREEFWRERARSRQRRRFQSIARTRRTRRRFPRIRRAHVHRRARARRIMRRDIFAKNIKRPMAKRCATTKSSPPSSPGNFKATARSPPPKLHREPLHFETVHLTQRSYK